jgi:hypothetical protein
VANNMPHPPHIFNCLIISLEPLGLFVPGHDMVIITTTDFLFYFIFFARHHCWPFDTTGLPSPILNCPLTLLTYCRPCFAEGSSQRPIVEVSSHLLILHLIFTITTTTRQRALWTAGFPNRPFRHR